MRNFWAAILLLLTLGIQADPPVITDINVGDHGGLTNLTITLNKNVELPPSMLGETVVVNLPDDVVWQAPTSLDESIGLVKGFHIEGGELVIHLEDQTALKEVLYKEFVDTHEVIYTFSEGNPHQAYSVRKETQEKISTSTPLSPQGTVVQSMHIDLQEGGSTRLSFKVNEPAPLKTEQNGTLLSIHVPHEVTLASPDITPKGHIQDLEVTAGENGGSVLQMQLTPGAIVHKTFTLSGEDPRYVVDIDLSQHIHLNRPPLPLADEKDVQPLASVLHMPMPPTQTVPSSPSLSEEVPPTAVPAAASAAAVVVDPATNTTTPQKVLTMTIHQAHGVTRLILGIEKPQHFHVVENEYMHQVHIRLPKTHWDKVKIHDHGESAIYNYFVDQSHPKWTTLVLTLAPEVTVLDQDVIFRFHHNPAFVLVIGEPGHAVPYWGQGAEVHWGQNQITPTMGAANAYLGSGANATQANDEGTVVQKDPFSFETEKPTFDPTDVYKAGTANFTDVGTGAYMGAQIVFASGRNKVTSTTGTNNSFSYNRNLDGFSGGGFVGYGKAFDRFYVGGEAFFHMAYQGGRTNVQSTAGGATFSYRDQTWYDYGLAFRIGAYVAPEALITFRIGAMGTTLQHKLSGNVNGLYGVPQRYTQNMAGILYGFGIESAFNNHMSLRLDINHIDFQHFTKKLTIGGMVQNARMAAKMEQVLLGITYKFDDMYGPNSPTALGIIPTGLYIGSGIDFSTMSYNRHFTGGAGNTFSMKNSALTPMWSMHLGYGIQHGKNYYGMELSASLGSMMLKESYTQGGVAESFEIIIQPTFGLYLRPGIAFGHGNLLYAKFGAVSSYFKRKGSANNATAKFTSSETMRKHMVGIAFGGGLEAFVNDHLSFRGEYMYEMYRKLEVAKNGIIEKFSPSNSRVTFAINYLF